MSELNRCEVIFNPKQSREDVRRIVRGYFKTKGLINPVLMFKECPQFVAPAQNTSEIDARLKDMHKEVTQSVSM